MSHLIQKQLTDDFGTKRICRKWYASEGSHIIHTCGRDAANQMIPIGEPIYDEEQDFWWQEGVWKDSPESGPRFAWVA
jgi:hypothetical protein